MTTSSIEFRHETTTSEQIGKVQLSFLAVFAANGPQLHKTYVRHYDIAKRDDVPPFELRTAFQAA